MIRHSPSFWAYLDALIQSAEVIIDRPRGTSHPRYPAMIYPLDYGYLAGTSAGDGDGIDVWRGSLAEGTLDAVICTVDARKRDVEVKLLIGCTAEEKLTVCDFHNRGESMAAILVGRAEAPLESCGDPAHRGESVNLGRHGGCTRGASL